MPGCQAMLAIVSHVEPEFMCISCNQFSFKSVPDVLGKYKAFLDMPMRPIFMWLGLAKAMSRATLAVDLLGCCQKSNSYIENHNFLA